MSDYLITNDGIWLVDYGNGIAKQKPYLKLNDLDFTDCVDTEGKTIYEYLENNGFVIDMDLSSETRIIFRE